MRKRKSKNGSGSYERHVFVDINLLCKFDEFMFINKGVMKHFIKCDEPTDARTDIGHFIISHPGPINGREIIIVVCSYALLLNSTKGYGKGGKMSK